MRLLLNSSQWGKREANTVPIVSRGLKRKTETSMTCAHKGTPRGWRKRRALPRGQEVAGAAAGMSSTQWAPARASWSGGGQQTSVFAEEKHWRNIANEHDWTPTGRGTGQGRCQTAGGKGGGSKTPQNTPFNVTFLVRTSDSATY